ncbi:cell division protein FtsQ [Paenibacillus sp. 32O-W]|uniref:cell division protein FtsQ/DivIB n=1 Tax=Paenibacillus sp. 32O-W TaxID=1695218 RepID=UPI0007216D2B|nr:FtsQ-type POTRA domain-containing protein [Paenibacillus sp. 32O-W]ALS27357.1 cell division protein FtsQ [Paenibacillus sp. 32O-W]
MSEPIPVLREPERKRRGNRKVLAVLLLLFVVLLAVLFFNSSISKISSLVIEGEMYLTAAEIREASGLAVGDAFFGARAATIEKRVKTLKPVKEVEVTKHFPGIVRIAVQEYNAVAFELSSTGELTAILSNGANIPVVGGSIVADKPVLTGWKPNDPVKAELSRQLARIPAKELSDISEITPYPSKAYPDRIKIYTRTRFEVVTAVSVLKDKIPMLNAVVETQQPGRVTMLLADTYEPYEQETDELETTQ